MNPEEETVVEATTSTLNTFGSIQAELDPTTQQIQDFLFGIFPDLTSACIGIAIAVFFIILFLGLLNMNRIHEFEKKQLIESKRKLRGVKGEKNESQMMDQLSKMVEDILDSESDKDINLEKRKKIKGGSMPLSYKIKKLLRDMMTNPYNTISVPKMVLASLCLAAVGLGLGAYLHNIVFCVSLAMVGLVAPIIFVSVTSIKTQLSYLQGNMGLITSHLGIFKEANSMADSFRALLNVLTPGTREYKAVYKAHGGLVEANMDLYVVIEQLKEDLLVDTTVGQYFDLCYIADTRSSEYKDALDYLPKRLEPIVMKNILYVSIVMGCFIAYCLCAGIIIFTLFYYSEMEPETFQYLTGDLVGQMVSFGIMGFFITIGLILIKISNLINII